MKAAPSGSAFLRHPSELLVISYVYGLMKLKFSRVISDIRFLSVEKWKQMILSSLKVVAMGEADIM